MQTKASYHQMSSHLGQLTADEVYEVFASLHGIPHERFGEDEQSGLNRARIAPELRKRPAIIAQINGHTVFTVVERLSHDQTFKLRLSVLEIAEYWSRFHPMCIWIFNPYLRACAQITLDEVMRLLARENISSQSYDGESLCWPIPAAHFEWQALPEWSEQVEDEFGPDAWLFWQWFGGLDAKGRCAWSELVERVGFVEAVDIKMADIMAESPDYDDAQAAA